MDSLHLRLHRMRDVLRRHMGHGEDVAVSRLAMPWSSTPPFWDEESNEPRLPCGVGTARSVLLPHSRVTLCTVILHRELLQEYLCRRCGATYTSLDAIRLLDPATGGFRCEECRSELDANVDASGLGEWLGMACELACLGQAWLVREERRSELGGQWGRHWAGHESRCSFEPRSACWVVGPAAALQAARHVRRVQHPTGSPLPSPHVPRRRERGLHRQPAAAAAVCQAHA